tara:strand:+ start:5831 stop:6472 length:642 start_codon:yes stop_codon:yes gene_type:complete
MAALVTVNEIRNYLNISSTEKRTTTDNLSSLANYASAVIETYCGRTFAAANVTELHDGGKSSIFVDRIPINSVNVLFEYDGYHYAELIGPEANGELSNLNANANAVIGYMWESDTGQIRRDVGLDSGFPDLTINDRAIFNDYKKGVKIDYNGGYTTIPDDLKMVTLDYIKLIYKQEQDASSFSFQGENKERQPLSANFPPHIRRVLDLYRILD